jgi:hypothetical protein
LSFVKGNLVERDRARPTSPPCIRFLDAASSDQFAFDKNTRPLQRATARARAGETIAPMIWRKTMNSIKTIAVAGLLAMMAAAPAFAQEAIQEPGAFAFFYPNLDVLNGGAPTPAYRMEGLPPSVMQSYNERESGLAGPDVWHHRVHHASSTMHDGRWHG